MSYQSVQEMFSWAAGEFGPQPAIDRVGRRVTYTQLEAESNRLANFLLEEGVSKGSIVALFTDDPIYIITGIIAVLKAGAVFVPLDPTFPEQRLQVMSEQVQPGWYVTEGKYLDKLSELRAKASFRAAFINFDREPSRVICIDRPSASSNRSEATGLEVLQAYATYENQKHPGIAADPDAPCSIYFTSGSTGKPKAILGRLKGIDHFIRWEIDAVGAKAGTRVSQLASPSFDGFLKDAFVPLSVGGVVCPPESRDVVMDAGRLADWLDVEQVEVMHCVPSVFRALLNKGLDSRYFEALKCIVMTGEPLYPSDVKRWIDIFGERIKLFNIYGTTETSLSKLQYEIKPEDVSRPSIPVGTPIRGSAVLIMDAASQPCHEGAVGEIYIRTPYRSFGYYGEPELTKQVFIQNPFSDDPADLVHKTGDFGRILEDGSLEILGRRDQQVQVRGVRVELGEIENLLRGHHAVADVAVVDRDDAEGNKFLVAYVIMNNGFGSEQLRHYLAERLPQTMLPSAFVELDELPRTLNGKIDRKALPALDVVQAERRGEDLAPRTPIEQIVADIWCEVLSLPAVGRTDNFFNLGGHSLLATQVILRVMDRLSVELPLRSMFESPTVEQLSLLIQAQVIRGLHSEPLPITPISRTERLPLSFAQQRLWFQEELARGTTTFHVGLSAKLKGKLNQSALEQTFGEIIRRHETLRTTFPVIDGELQQAIAQPSRFRIPIVDLSHLSETEKTAAADRLAAAEFAQPFELAAGPLTRTILVRHSADEHSIICTMHHIISDGWSKGLLIKEISTIYGAFSQGDCSPLPELSLQFADFAAWQRQRLQGDALEQELAYWKSNLADAAPLLNLPLDKPRPPIQTYRGAAEPFIFSKDLLDRLKTLSQRRGTTLFMTLLAAFQVFLHRYSAQDDVVVGTTIANRERSEIEGLIGFFVNMLALRADCSGDPRFDHFLEQVRETTLKGYAYQGMPFERLVQELQPKRNPGYLPLFQVVFSFQNQPTLTQLTLPGLSLSFPPLEITTSLCDLLLDVNEGKDGLTGAFQYNPDLFERETIVRMIEHFGNLLEGIASDPEQRLSDLPLLSTREKTECLLDWNGTQSEYPHDTAIHELFEGQAAASPDSVAVVCGGDHLSYAELNRKANQLARFLRKKSVKAGDLVGICLEHSFEEVVAMLGTLKAGAGYVPLDPNHPQRRLSFTIKDAGAAILLTQRSLTEQLGECDAALICLDNDWSSIALESDENLRSQVSEENIAYSIYTSGSTGEPKGVRIPHRALVNYAWWAKDIYLQNEKLGFALYSSSAFDLTVTSIYVPLISGNAIVIPGEARKEVALTGIIADERIGVLKLTPSHLSLIKDADNSQTGVRRLIVGGEWFGTALARQIHESFAGRVQIFNEYGPTEATVGCMIYQFDAVEDRRSAVPVGRPAANVQLYVLDQWLKPTAPNVSGELYIAGAGLAEGYGNRPDLTAERFLPNPFADGQRMYRTGDLCRRLPSGDLEYLGRKDEQVKFHGYRVELNEIRWALKNHPAIENVAVVVGKDKNGIDLMAAYYVAAEQLHVAELRAFLSEILIAETIPNVFIHLSELPLSINGKIDYDALPSIEEAKQKSQREYVAPRTTQEEMLARIWAEVLSVERAGIDDNFFDLGGHSLLAMQIVHRINQTFDVELRMRALFDEPTIAGLSLLLEEALIEKLEAAPELALSKSG